MLPRVEKILLARARLDRRIATLRCVEAIRLYAAVHGGKLPAKLDDVKDVPVPLDPVTGQAYPYKLTGERALLSAEPLPGFSPAYELILRR
jgi:hypothetical protein